MCEAPIMIDLTRQFAESEWKILFSRYFHSPLSFYSYQSVDWFHPTLRVSIFSCLRSNSSALWMNFTMNFNNILERFFQCVVITDPYLLCSACEALGPVDFAESQNWQLRYVSYSSIGILNAQVIMVRYIALNESRKKDIIVNLLTLTAL